MYSVDSSATRRHGVCCVMVGQKSHRRRVRHAVTEPVDALCVGPGITQIRPGARMKICQRSSSTLTSDNSCDAHKADEGVAPKISKCF